MQFLLFVIFPGIVSCTLSKKSKDGTGNGDSSILASPFPLWETTLTHKLVQHQWKELNSKGFINYEQYSTAGVWLNKPSLAIDKKIQVSGSSLCVELPSLLLNPFYEEHGLELLSEEELAESKALLKLSKALSVLRLVEPVYACICDLVKSIHILRQPDAEIDLSYSHPQIPFSIFVSVCEDDSLISNLRVAESILHEAMHLKLTLIENIIPLVKPNTNTLYYSPWREEERPVRGIFHGLFVFRAIVDLHKRLLESQVLSQVEEYVLNRVNQITKEINQIKNFPSSIGLTTDGANLAVGLLPSS